MTDQDTIWIVINAEDTQGRANNVNAAGCKTVCDARIDAKADMMYPTLHAQAALRREGDRIVMHQGGARGLGGQLLTGAGWVSSRVRTLTSEYVATHQHLWEVTATWYRHWPASPDHLHGELIIDYKLQRAESPQSSPKAIRPRQGAKFIPLHKNCRAHTQCSAYNEVDAFWHKTISKMT